MRMSCWNPDCGRPLSTFAEGRLFHFEIRSISVSADDRYRKADDEISNRETLQYWLCGSCSERMVLSMDALAGLQLVPAELATAECGASPLDRFHERLDSQKQG